jgi:DNA-binding MarR family transcriptional regulator
MRHKPALTTSERLILAEVRAAQPITAARLLEATNVSPYTFNLACRKLRQAGLLKAVDNEGPTTYVIPALLPPVVQHG